MCRRLNGSERFRNRAGASYRETPSSRRRRKRNPPIRLSGGRYPRLRFPETCGAECVLRAAAAIPAAGAAASGAEESRQAQYRRPKAQQANLSPPDPKAIQTRRRTKTSSRLNSPNLSRHSCRRRLPPCRLACRFKWKSRMCLFRTPPSRAPARRAWLFPTASAPRPFRKALPPPPNAPPGPENVAGNGKTDVAVVSLHPGNGPVPDGARSGAFSRAPNVGEPATGEVSGSGLRVPNLTIREDRSKIAEAPKVNPNRKVVLYADKMRSIPVTTLSVPLRPAARTIPRAHRCALPGTQCVHHGGAD